MVNRSKPATTIATWASTIWMAIESYGLQPHSLFERAGVTPARLHDPLHRYPVSAMTQLWELAVDATGDESFGLTVARFVNPSTFYALGYSLMASSSRLDAAKRLIRFADMISDGVQFDMREVNNHWHLIFEMKPGYPPLAPACTEAIFGSLVHIGRHYIQWGEVLHQIAFKHCAPKNIQPYAEFFDCEVLFDQPDYAVISPEGQNILRGFVTSNAALASANDAVIEEYLQSRREELLSTKVRQIILASMEGDLLSQTKVAQQLNMSERKLQQNLKSEDTSFKDILEDVRQILAEKWLLTGKKNISEIAWSLGFKEVSSFSRAFKRWTGVSPRDFLKKTL